MAREDADAAASPASEIAEIWPVHQHVFPVGATNDLGSFELAGEAVARIKAYGRDDAQRQTPRPFGLACPLVDGASAVDARRFAEGCPRGS
jgi:hypothetical protein